MAFKTFYTAQFIGPGKQEAIKPLGSNREYAIAKIKALSELYPSDRVYLCFYRSLDQIRGYINPDGSDGEGRPW